MEPSDGFGSQGWGGGGQEAAALKQLCALEGWGPGGPGELQWGGGAAGRPQEQSVHRTLREGPPVGAFGCRQRVQQDTSSLSPLPEFFVVSTLSKFVEVKSKEAEFCILACGVTRARKRS